MKYCSNCLQPNTRPNSKFTKNGLCPACDYFKKTEDIDWMERFETMQEVLKSFPRNHNQIFDCIIGVSGGKDSTRQALWVRDKLNLKPLLVCLAYPPEQITRRGASNISNLIALGFDLICISPAPKNWRKIVREGFLNFTNWAKATEQAIIGSAPQMAIKYNIPLILWGENPGLQLGDLKTLGKTGYDGNNLKYMNTVSGGNLDWLLDKGFTSNDLISFKYPESSEFEKSGIQIIYLGWFWEDWSLINNGVYSVTSGLDIRDEFVEDAGDITQVSSLDEDWVTLNQMIKYYKFGFGRVTDHVNEALRNGTIKREKAIELCTEYDGACNPKYIESFCQYIDISVNEFWDKVKSSVNKKLFDISKSGRIVPKFKVGIGLNEEESWNS